MTAIPVRTGVPVYRLRGAGFAPAPRAFDGPLCPPAAAPVCAPPRPPLCSAPGNASKGGLRSVLFSMRGAVSPSHRHRVRAVGFRSRARGVFSLVALRLPARLCPAPVRDIRRWRGTSKSSAFCPVPVRNIRRWRGTSKSSAFCPAPVRDNVLFSPQHGITAARQRRFPVRRIFTPVPHSFSRASAFSRRARIPVLFLDNPRARRL